MTKQSTLRWTKAMLITSYWPLSTRCKLKVRSPRHNALAFRGIISDQRNCSSPVLLLLRLPNLLLMLPLTRLPEDLRCNPDSQSL